MVSIIVDVVQIDYNLNYPFISLDVKFVVPEPNPILRWQVILHWRRLAFVGEHTSGYPDRSRCCVRRSDV